MARVFITGSSDGLGLMAASLVVEQGHNVVLHARNEDRANEVRSKLPGADAIVSGDLSSIAQTKSVAEQVNQLGRFDAIIHNASVGYREPERLETEDGLPLRDRLKQSILGSCCYCADCPLPILGRLLNPCV